MKAITLRGFPPQVAREIEKKAKQRHESLNRTVVGLLEKALGLSKEEPAKKVYHDMDRFFGTWSKEEADAFDMGVKEQRKVDPEVWR
jgi:hypothetical protein